jgi:putative CocE/NonD family hydrolase
MKKITRRLLTTGIIIIIILGLLVILYRAFKWNITAWYLGIPQPKYSVSVERNVMIPMRDGIKLAADIYRPETSEKLPVIIIRTPYGKRNPGHRYEFIANIFSTQGYVFIVQDVRGKYDSEGDYYPYVNEPNDGHDTIEWAGTQNWSTGKVGTFGISYWGRTQWLAAPQASRYLKAMIPIFCGQYTYKRWADGGVFRFDALTIWHYQNALKTARTGREIDWDRILRHLPLIEVDDNLGEDIVPYNDKIQNPVPGPYWNKMRVDNKVSRIKAPALIGAGWYDFYRDCSLDDYNRMRLRAGSDEARKSQLIIGPWIHITRSKFDDVDFGKEASFLKQVKTFLRWFNYWLKDEQNGILDEGPVRVFVMGRNEWRSEKEWPPKRAVEVKYYLHSEGTANTVHGTGFLNTDMPEDEKFDQFTYDPADPVPSIGSASIYGNARPGPVDQREVESRKDVLIYTTPPLEEEIEVTGIVKLILFAASSARDTDFIATLTDVYPDGKSINLTTGVVRARYRESLAKPSLLEKGKVYRFEISVGPTSILFKRGHRIRLQVKSSHFPEFSRNLNTGAPIGMAKEIVKAYQTVYHNMRYASYLLLPVIPPVK